MNSHKLCPVAHVLGQAGRQAVTREGIPKQVCYLTCEQRKLVVRVLSGPRATVHGVVRRETLGQVMSMRKHIGNREGTESGEDSSVVIAFLKRRKEGSQ